MSEESGDAEVQLTTDPNDRRLIFKLAEKVLVEDEAVLFPFYYGANGVVTRAYLHRTYSSDGYGGYIAEWQIGWNAYLPVISRTR